jgi:F-type H+-transporting ATPase subunit b
MQRLPFLTLALISTAASVASAAAEKDASVIAAPKEGAATAITALVVFVIAFGILATLVWPKISKGLADRNAKIKAEIAAAEEARKQAKDALNEYERNLAEARAEAQKMLEETRSQQAAMAAELRAKADVELNALREKAKLEIEAAKKQALAEIYTESVNVATAMAGKILQREVSVSDQQRLMDESLAELRTANA